MFLCLKSENFRKLWLTRRESGFSENWLPLARSLAFHFFKNLRLFDKKIVAGLQINFSHVELSLLRYYYYHHMKTVYRYLVRVTPPINFTFSDDSLFL